MSFRNVKRQPAPLTVLFYVKKVFSTVDSRWQKSHLSISGRKTNFINKLRKCSDQMSHYVEEVSSGQYDYHPRRRLGNSWNSDWGLIWANLCKVKQSCELLFYISKPCICNADKANLERCPRCTCGSRSSHRNMMKSAWFLFPALLTFSTSESGRFKLFLDSKCTAPYSVCIYKYSGP